MNHVGSMIRGVGWACSLVVLGGFLAEAQGQMVTGGPPVPGPGGAPINYGPPPPPPPEAVLYKKGWFKNWPWKRDHHYKFHDNFAGWPQYFPEPPLGSYLAGINSVNINKADPHRFMVYRSDFVGDSTTLSPAGAQRMSLIAARLNGWQGPILVEWSPDKQGLAEARRTAVESMFQSAGIPVASNRVMLSPAPFPGGFGFDGVNNYDNIIIRSQDAARTFSRTPVPQATLIGSGGP